MFVTRDYWSEKEKVKGRNVEGMKELGGDILRLALG